LKCVLANWLKRAFVVFVVVFNYGFIFIPTLILIFLILVFILVLVVVFDDDFIFIPFLILILLIPIPILLLLPILTVTISLPPRLPNLLKQRVILIISPLINLFFSLHVYLFSLLLII
jgi:hypothetical protein